jgi:hypothetical protein
VGCSTDLANRIRQLERRLEQLEDHAAISELKAAYCDAADGGWDRESHDADAIVEMFVKDGTWDGGALGVAHGAEEIRALFLEFKRFQFAFHRVTNPRISIQGDTATGSWHLVNAVANGERHRVLGGIYHDEFIRTGEGWRFASITALPVHSARADWLIVNSADA